MTDFEKAQALLHEFKGTHIRLASVSWQEQAKKLPPLGSPQDAFRQKQR